MSKTDKRSTNVPLVSNDNKEVTLVIPKASATDILQPETLTNR